MKQFEILIGRFASRSAFYLLASFSSTEVNRDSRFRDCSQLLLIVTVKIDASDSQRLRKVISTLYLEEIDSTLVSLSLGVSHLALRL